MNMRQPLVSINITTYNSSKFIIETLESAKMQTYQNIELIVSDDSSVDNTVELCKKWIEKNKGKHKDIVADKNGVFLKIKDEEEIFEIADSYLDAVAEGNVKKYWETF